LVLVAKIENKDLNVDIKASDHEALTVILNIILKHVSNIPAKLTSHTTIQSEMTARIEGLERELRIILEQYEVARKEILSEE